MPDIRARSWFIKVAQLFGQQLDANDICNHAQLIGISNPNDLLACIRPTGTDTTRQIIRRLYPLEKLLEKSGPEAVSDTKRKVIRNFVELQNGQLPDHQFNEAINGVFRQAKLGMRNEETNTKSTTVQKTKCVDGQQSINNMFHSKKSTSISKTNLTKTCTNTILDTDDDDNINSF